ncbi:indolepyruvate ferredoxin oxidoreductase subunit alpha [Desulfolutivibrio sulfoxidireducens]|uniref:indolepyruvate ferredoxin oxidoreductase subunit alpha n=1 Tax=Desulfolutivibrio sulfoxidireducens TaxID=2773299 RepID=UPI00159E17AC|nr:indolepyruvate ferredoxin oxidoreductase subunit alpha [Desulfolutivibrio sulfoxidireducens]QLA15578.1 indolepyruvate ferredoxin oxidoreductase subunit alpha [Desulfolutivibrio sulfoxidireducens]QLA19181.1 indolepyruvate ferredoxin oxidoreductase subunit alpha [Desulfolutivibrio sulfoxidireducens]
MGKELLDRKAGARHFLLGNEAIVRGALEAGVDVVTCYPGTPSSEVPDTFFRLSPDGPYRFEYSVNEKVALEVAAGASLAGALAFTTMKHVGVNVAADPLLTLAYVGSPGGLVLLSADDPGCHSSQNEQDNRWYARLAGLPCIEPATAMECKDFVREALALSREFGHPVLVRTTTRVNHVRGPVTFAALPEKTPPAPFVKNPPRYVPLPASARVMHLELLKKLEALAARAETSPLNTVSGQGSVGFVASGICRAYLRDVLFDEGLTGAVKVLDLGFSHPLPQNLIADFARGLDRLVVLEEVDPIVENEIRTLFQRRGIACEVVGKGEGLPRYGEYSTDIVRGAVRAALCLPPTARTLCAVPGDLPRRPPNMCAGCPHRATYHAARKVFGDEPVYSSDIGCYTLGIQPPLSAADFLFCMGSSISAGSGFAAASGRPVVAFIGDSTFFHSGITGLINAVANQHELLLVILDNRTTGMTGHQPNPGVDHTIFGEFTSKVDLAGLVRACGVEPVIVNPLHHKATTAALAELRDKPGVRVLIAQAPCPIHARKVKIARKTPPAAVAGDPAKCTQCRDELACPAFVMVEGVFAINAEACSGCMYCVQLSPEIKARRKEG